MPIPTLITELSTTAASNYPQGSDSPATLDDVQRAHGSFIAQLRDGVGFTSPIPIAGGGTGSSTAATARTALGVAIGTDVQAYDANTLKSNASKSLSAGYTATDYNSGTKTTGTFTPDPVNGNFQYCVNGGAFTLAPPTNSCTMVIQITNNASAGVITTGGFTKVSGTAPGVTNGDDFLAFITRANGFTHLSWQALQ